MGHYIFCSLYIMMPLILVESFNFSTRLEYKKVDIVPQEYLEVLKPFQNIGGKFYYIESKELNWFQAVQECRQKGGNLINLTTDPERLLVGLQLNKSQHYWLDINKLGQNEYFSIATGLTPPYVKWLEEDSEDKDSPHKENEQFNCVVLVYDYEDAFVMKKTQCLEKASFICQLSSPRTISIVVW